MTRKKAITLTVLGVLVAMVITACGVIKMKTIAFREAPTPAGWPDPTPVGEIRAKDYPAARMAVVTASDQGSGSNGIFMRLFKHIKRNNIPMTSPVQMDYEGGPAPGEDDVVQRSMAFYYQHKDTGKTGRDGEVQVVDVEPVTVVSIGLKGSYRKANFRKAHKKLLAWLGDNRDRYVAAGPMRVLAYNSPFVPWWAKYSEVQIPIRAAADGRSEQSPSPLTDEEKRIILEKGTERPFSGKYWNQFEPGTYCCRQCGSRLYLSESKFRSSCGWPSFDQEVPGAVKRQLDADGVRTEIVCAACSGHLGHVFEGEDLTPKNVRHCVNSVSLVFHPARPAANKEAVFAGGCFWGVEHYFNLAEGVAGTTVGYTGGDVANPTYEQVCTGRTGHAEAVRVTYDPKRISYERLVRLFFEIHDPTQLDRQGADVGTQYRSAVFYFDEHQEQTVRKLIAKLKAKGYQVVTKVLPASQFYPAEEHHQDYFAKHPKRPLCHGRVPRFETAVK